MYVPPLVEAFSWFGTRLYFGFSSLDISCVFACMHTNNGQHFTYRKTFNSKYLTSRIFYKTKTTIEWVVIRWKFTKLPTFIRHGCSFITNFSSKTWFRSCWFHSVFVQLFIPLLLFFLSLMHWKFKHIFLSLVFTNVKCQKVNGNGQLRAILSTVFSLITPLTVLD